MFFNISEVNNEFVMDDSRTISKYNKLLQTFIIVRKEEGHGLS